MHWKKSLLVIHKFPRLFVKTLTVDDKHYMLNRDNWTQPIQIHLYQKQKTFFSDFFFPFWKFILNFKHLPKKDDPHSWCISGNPGSEKHGYINAWKALFERTLRQRTWQIGRNDIPIWMTAPFQNLLITVKVVVLEKVSSSNRQIPKTVC